MLSIQLISPIPNSTVYSSPGKGSVLSVTVTQACGVPFCAGGRWKPEHLNVTASITYLNSQYEIQLSPTGKTGEFNCLLPLDFSGVYDIIINASDSETGDAGRSAFQFRVEIESVE